MHLDFNRSTTAASKLFMVEEINLKLRILKLLILYHYFFYFFALIEECWIFLHRVIIFRLWCIIREIECKHISIEAKNHEQH